MNDQPLTPTHGRLLGRALLAGPLSFACAALVMCGAALWLPGGAAQIDNIVLPIVLFPAIWAAIFFYTCLDRRLGRAYLTVGGLCVGHAVVIAVHLSGALA